MGLFKRKAKKKRKLPNNYRLSDNEITRETIKSMGANGVSGIDGNLLIEKLLYFYDNKIPVPERINILMETFNIDEETSKMIEYVQMSKISLISDYLINKDRGANKFDIEGGNKTLKKNININEFPNYVGFMIDNKAYPLFYMD